MPSDARLKAQNKLLRLILTLSGGRIGSNLAGMPTLELTTTGRKSGEPRTVMLTAPVVTADNLVVVASRAGDDRPPAWYLNLTSTPEVQVTIDGKTTQMIARTASTEERQELWPKVTGAFKGYASYQRKTSREIPLVILTPKTSEN